MTSYQTDNVIINSKPSDNESLNGQYFAGHINPIVDFNSNEDISSISTSKIRHVRYVYCGDGVVEECDEDEEEKQQLEAEEKQRRKEEQQRLDIEAKNLPWMPWMSYMAKRNASKSFEACDFMGEKLAWWLGITKPKFFYEIEEYKRMKKEEEESQMEDDDRAEEIVIGPDGKVIDSNTSDDIQFRVDSNLKTNQDRAVADHLFQNN